MNRTLVASLMENHKERLDKIVATALESSQIREEVAGRKALEKEAFHQETVQVTLAESHS